MGFPEGLRMLIVLEGGYVLSDLFDDSGGVTFAGITHATWIDYCLRKALPQVWPPSIEQVGTFYLTEYWEARHCSELPAQAAAIWLQCAVDMPYAAANLLLQGIARVWPMDGDIGPLTLMGLARYHPDVLSDAILTAQMQHYLDVRGPKDQLFKGLRDRIETVHRYIGQGLI